MISEKFTGLLTKLIRSKIDRDTKQSILSRLEYLLEHTEIEGTKDGVKITFKKKV